MGCLQKVHENGIVHCDVKPKNILAKDVTCMSTPYLIDFGLAFHLNTNQNGKCKHFIGTPDYSSDDRLLSKRDPSPIDDMISLGYCALHAYLGDLPWRCLEPCSYGCSAKSYLLQFTRERQQKMKQGLKEWPGFFREWFEYCDQVLETEEKLSYDRLKHIIEKNEFNLAEQNFTPKGKRLCMLSQESVAKKQRCN